MRPYPPCAGVEHTYVLAGEVKLHVATAGPADGPAVVLLHGWPEHWWLWRDVIPALAGDGYRVIAPDLRGFGWSEVTAGGYEKEQFATDIIALLDALGIERCDLVGHDWGGWTAQLVALRAPARVRRLAVLNIPHPWMGLTARGARHVHKIAYQPLMGAPVIGPLAHRGPLLWTILRRQGIAADAVAEYRANYRAPGRAVAGSKVYRAWVRREVAAVLRGRYRGQRLPMPTRVLFGRDDLAIDPSLLDGWEDHADDVRITWVEDCGHFIVDEQPATVVGWLREVLAEPA
jgi:pimeloyl-ACP methyl ester carboxylesterase